MAENFFGITDIGRLRQNNEDAFIAQKVMGDNFIMACVIDGVGGYEGGEVAASIARQSILDYFKIPSGDVITMMKEAIIAANQKIQQEKQANSQYESMACVLTLAVIDTKNKQFFYAHVGDTRLYLLRDDSLVKLTKDHSFVGFLEDSGRLSEDEAMNHPKRNEINKALGFEAIGINTDYIETGTSPFLPGDLILLCSDGLTDLVSNREMTSILTADKSLEEKGQLLISAANERGGKDNITAVIVHNNNKPLKQKVTKPVAVKKNETEVKEFIGSEPIKIEQAPVKKRKRNGAGIAILSLLVVALLGTLLWYMSREKDEKIEPAIAIAPIVQQSKEGSQLADSLQSSKNKKVIIDSIFKSPIVLSDTLLVDRDSLQLIGDSNTVIRSDSSYSGPAFVIKGNLKYVSLENITFENFKIAIVTETSALRLKNVRFKNCANAIQHQMIFKDSFPVNGSLKNNSFQSDTSIQTTLRNR